MATKTVAQAISFLTQVIKRDGSVKPFDSGKIASALLRAGQASGEFGSAEAERLTQQAVLQKIAPNRAIPHVEQIQDAVETVLFDAGHRNTLRAYIVYREQHSSLRTDRQTLVDVESSINEYLRDPVVLRKRGLDVEPDPIQQRQDFRQPFRVGAGAVQSDIESQFAHRADGVRQRRIDGRFTAAEYHRIDQPDPPLQQIQHLLPRERTLAQARLQMRVMAITAAPRATLHEHHRRQFARVIGGSERRYAAHFQRSLTGQAGHSLQ